VATADLSEGGHRLQEVRNRQEALRAIAERQLDLVADLQREAVDLVKKLEELGRSLAAQDEPTVRDRIRAVLRRADGPIPMAEVVRRVREAGSTARDDTIRSLLTDMSKAGQARRVGRGVYQAVIDRD
jgi:CheY-like chemotaxis protein